MGASVWFQKEYVRFSRIKRHKRRGLLGLPARASLRKIERECKARLEFSPEAQKSSVAEQDH
jgi:hypothetical protein